MAALSAAALDPAEELEAVALAAVAALPQAGYRHSGATHRRRRGPAMP